MRILVDGIPKNKGGIGTLLMNIVQCNRENNTNRDDSFEFEFLVPYGSEYVNDLEAYACKYYFVPSITNISYRKTICKILKNGKYDYIWINNSSKVNIWLLKMGKKIGNARIITHVHGTRSEEKGLKAFVFKILEKINRKEYLNLVDIPMACSQAAAKYFYGNDFGNNIVILNNGINLKKFVFNKGKRNIIRRELGFDNSDVVVGTIGRLTKAKNYDFVINITRELPDNYKTIIIGDGEEYHDIKKSIKINGLEKRISMLGLKNNVNDYLSAMDIFIMPSLYEGMPFSLIEAQANGVKCIVSDRITREADLTGKVIFLDITNANIWKEVIINQRDLTHEDNSNIITDSGYDIMSSYIKFKSILTRVAIYGYNN